MIFSNSQHYNIEKYMKNNNHIEDIVDCFICYEIEDREKNKSIKLGKQQKYLKNCKCDGHLHITCLDKWHKMNSTCPICRKRMFLNITNKPYTFYIQTYVLRNGLFTMLRIFALLFGFYFSIRQKDTIIEIIHMLNFIEKTRYVFTEYENIN
jgi:hypothetical protein